MKRLLLLEPPTLKDDEDDRDHDDRILAQRRLSMPTMSGTLSVYSRFLNTSLLYAYQKMEVILATKKLR